MIAPFGADFVISLSIERTPMKTLPIWLQTLLAAFIFAAPASAATFSLTPTADAFLTGGSNDPNAGSQTANYGGAGALQVSAAGSTKGEIQSLLKFDLSAAKASFDATFGAGNWTVNSITLQLGTNFGVQGTQPNNPIFNSINGGLFKIDWMANDSWVEGTGTPASPTTNGVTFSDLAGLIGASDETLGTFTYTPVGNTNPPTVPEASYALSLAPSFLADVTGGSIVSLRAYAGDAGVSYLFNSRSFSGNQPTLVIDAVPEPGAGTLLAMGTLAWLVRRRRYAPAA
jgi:uncharacterized protein (TIGR03382 family)